MKHKGDVRGVGEALGNAEKLLYSYIRGDYRLHMWKTEIDRRLIATDEFKP